MTERYGTAIRRDTDARWDAAERADTREALNALPAEVRALVGDDIRAAQIARAAYFAGVAAGLNVAARKLQ